MKAENLLRLRDAGFPVPDFRIVSDPAETDLGFSYAERFAVRSSFSVEVADGSGGAPAAQGSAVDAGTAGAQGAEEGKA
ncbi:MAG: hypothetical protein IIZ60_00370 [Clostridia bacterium]|nr:hypothetical protein [Clostridia bacterium]